MLTLLLLMTAQAMVVGVLGGEAMAAPAASEAAMNRVVIAFMTSYALPRANPITVYEDCPRKVADADHHSAHQRCPRNLEGRKGRCAARLAGPGRPLFRYRR